MNANLSNAGLELLPKMPRLEPKVPAGLPHEPARPRHEAFESLLAFSALHQQVLERKRATSNGANDTWELDQFALDEVLQLVAEKALAMTGADGVAIALAEYDSIVCRASAGHVAPDVGRSVQPNSGFSGACLTSGNTVRCDDVETDSSIDAPSCRRLGARSMLAVPLCAKQTIVGLIEAFSGEPHSFNESDEQSLSLLAGLILAAIRPEQEDRLAEISRKVLEKARLETAAVSATPIVPIVAPPVEKNEPEAHEVEPAVAPAPLFTDYETAEKRPGITVVTGVVCLAMVLGGGLWWLIWRSSGTTPAKHASAGAAESIPASTGAAPSAFSLPEHVGESKLDDGTSAIESSSKPGTIAAVTGIRHWTSGDSSTVVVDLEDQVQYEAHRLADPERIYFDLHDTKLSSAVSSKPIEVQDQLLERIRVAQPVPGVTRVVLDTKGASNFSVSLETNPYRLVVEIRKIGAKPQERARVDLFAPQVASSIPSASVAAPPAATARAVAGNPKTTVVAPPSLRIALDAGHGGWDLGTVGRRGLLEKDLVLDIVQRVGKLIEQRLGAAVIYTRKDDEYLALEKRAEIANAAHVDLFLSVHANYSDYPSARGVETYYSDTYSSVKAREAGDSEPALQNIDWTHIDIREKVHESHRFAASVQRALFAALTAKTPGITNRGVKEAQYVVLTGTLMPAILAEVSFVSSPADEGNLQSAPYRQQIAEALFRGVAQYSDESNRVKLVGSMAKPSR